MLKYQDKFGYKAGPVIQGRAPDCVAIYSEAADFISCFVEHRSKFEKALEECGKYDKHYGKKYFEIGIGNWSYSIFLN